MAGDVFKNFNIIEVFLENSNQKVLLTKDKDTNELYLVNVVTNKNILEGVNLENLKQTFNSIENIYHTEDAVYIITKYLEYSNIKEYLSNHKIILSKQIEYMTVILDALLRIKAYPQHVVLSLINSNNIFIDNTGKIHFSGLISLDEEGLNVNKSDIFNELANIAHIIFAGTIMKNNVVSVDVPPDINRIIYNCLNNEYLKYEDFISDFKGSNLYKFINPESEESKKMHQIRKKLTRRKTFNRFKKRGIITAIIIIALLPVLVPYGINMFKENNKVNIEDNEYDAINSDNEFENNDDESEGNDNIDNEYNDTEDEEKTQDETIEYFFSEELIHYADATKTGEIDTSKFYEGNSSVKIINTENRNREFLVGVIDLNSDMFSFLKERKIDISMWLTSSIDIDGVVTLKVLKGDKVLSKISKKIQISDDIWELNNIDIQTGNGERIEIYVNIPEKSAAWIDSFSVDILK